MQSDFVGIILQWSRLDFDIGFHDVTFQTGNPVHASLDELIETYPPEIRRRLYLMS